MDRFNINRGYEKLQVWKDAVSLYVMTCDVLIKFPYILNKVASNAIDSSHSISRNISEGYCRRSIKEYLNFLNIALASYGELHSSLCSFLEAKQISENDFEKIDQLHYKTENELINLIKSLQKKKLNNDWNDSFI
jgi:four helix bundle protein